jgi:dihydroorotase
LTLEQVIERATVNAAKAMRKPELGSLKPGSAADVALFRIDEGDFTFQDIFLNERKGTKLLVNTGTFVDGEQLPSLPERPLHFFAKLPERQAGKVIPIRPVS